jgi:hypothetical protein
MMILLVFNRQKGYPPRHFKLHLRPQNCPKVGIVLKRPNVKVLDVTDRFMLNTHYHPPHETHEGQVIIITLMKPQTLGENAIKVIELHTTTSTG